MEHDENLRYLRTRNIPHSVIGSPHVKDDTLWVDNDNKQAMYDITMHHIGKGYKKIAFISGSMDYIFNENRFAGYKKALNENGISIDKALVKETDATFEGGFDAMTDLMKEPLLDCVAATDDVLAFGAIDAMMGAQKLFPISGFNNTPMCEYVSPKLTSVDILSEKLGYDACLLLIDKLENGDQMQMKSHNIETMIIKRKSTQ